MRFEEMSKKTVESEIYSYIIYIALFFRFILNSEGKIFVWHNLRTCSRYVPPFNFIIPLIYFGTLNSLYFGRLVCVLRAHYTHLSFGWPIFIYFFWFPFIFAQQKSQNLCFKMSEKEREKKTKKIYTEKSGRKNHAKRRRQKKTTHEKYKKLS